MQPSSLRLAEFRCRGRFFWCPFSIENCLILKAKKCESLATTMGEAVGHFSEADAEVFDLGEEAVRIG